MRTPLPSTAVAIVLATVLSVPTACSNATEDEPGAPADTAPPAAGETAAGPEAAAAVEVTVTNPMPHAMIVEVAADDGATRLGIVPASGEQSFVVEGEPGSTVVLHARDEADTHSVEGEVVLSEDGARWTIQ